MRVDHSTLPAKLEMHINGKILSTRQLESGLFEFKVPIQTIRGRQRLDLIFNNYYQLSSGADARIVAAKIDYIGFVKG